MTRRAKQPRCQRHPRSMVPFLHQFTGPPTRVGPLDLPLAVVESRRRSKLGVEYAQHVFPQVAVAPPSVLYELINLLPCLGVTVPVF